MAQIRGFFQYIRRNITLGIGVGHHALSDPLHAIGFTRIDPKVDPYPLAAPASLAADAPVLPGLGP